MKVYLFNIENGVYAGEDFTDEVDVCEEEGITKLAPPMNYPGQVPVFDRVAGAWHVLPIDEVRKGADDHE